VFFANAIARPLVSKKVLDDANPMLNLSSNAGLELFELLARRPLSVSGSARRLPVRSATRHFTERL
jgi:hypothetical protein